MNKFIGIDGRYHIVYRTHNLINGKEYTGKHSTYNLDDGYYGTSAALESSIKIHGIENFAVEILSFHKTEQEAYEREFEIVDQDYVNRVDTYNACVGGLGCLAGRAVYKDKYGNRITTFIDDERVLNGELIHINKGKSVVKDKDGNIFSIRSDDPRILSGELIHHSNGSKHPGVNKGKVNVRDKDGNTMQVSVDDPRYLNGELKSLTDGKVVVKDKNGIHYSVHISDPRYLNGELVHASTNRISVKDKNGNTFSITKDDPRFLSGELVGVMNGRKTGKHSLPANKIICPHCRKEGHPSAMKLWHFEKCKKNPNRSNDLITCPHCGKEGRGPNMTRYHFDNCKELK